RAIAITGVEPFIKVPKAGGIDCPASEVANICIYVGATAGKAYRVLSGPSSTLWVVIARAVELQARLCIKVAPSPLEAIAIGGLRFRRVAEAIVVDVVDDRAAVVYDVAN